VDSVQALVRGAELVSFLVALVLMVVFHEGLHGLFFWVFTRAKPRFGLSLMYAYAAAPDWYIPRNRYLVVGLAPFVILTAAGLIAIAWLPHAWLAAGIFMVSLNAAGSVGDLFVTGWLLAHGPQVLINDTGAGFTAYAPESVS
jgi:hypothetical protein